MNLNILNFPDDILAGQKIITGFEGDNLNKNNKDYFLKIKPGGIILFARNIKNQTQLKKLNSDINQFFKEKNIPPPFISIDQEGGTVSRLKEPEFKEFPAVAELSNASEAEDHSKKMSEILNQFYINMNMAPVLDVASLNKKSIMEKRSFPGTPEQVADLGIAAADGYIKNNIIPVGKHFPGIGNTTTDSHFVLPVYNEKKDFFIKNDLLPFKKAADNNIPALMFSHILYKELDDKWPASLSEKISKDILRNEIKYNGVTMTDDLDMKAVSSDIKTSSHQIIKADVDIALVCHSFENTETIHKIFLEKISDKNKEVLNSVQRIFDLKNRFLY
ncbi:MAG: glycoside hydrolase family 3 N-terminal domain-containing protein [Thermodesulfobacteriota bacterium]